MYVFGIDIPLIELIIALGVVGVIILLEITILLVLISYHMKNSRKLEGQIGRLLHALTKLNKEELVELEKIRKMEDQEERIVSGLKRFKTAKPEKVSHAAGKLSPRARKKLYKTMSKSKKNIIVDTVDKFLGRWKK